MTNFILRLLKRRGVEKKRPSLKGLKKDDSSDGDDDEDNDDGVIHSKFDYDEGTMAVTLKGSQEDVC